MTDDREAALPRPPARYRLSADVIEERIRWRVAELEVLAARTARDYWLDRRLEDDPIFDRSFRHVLKCLKKRASGE